MLFLWVYTGDTTESQSVSVTITFKAMLFHHHFQHLYQHLGMVTIISIWYCYCTFGFYCWQYCYITGSVQFSSVAQSCPTATPWIAARQASLSITNSRNSTRLTSIESVTLSSHLILCHPLLLPPIPPSIRVFSNESTLRMRWPEYWSFSFSIIPS